MFRDVYRRFACTLLLLALGLLGCGQYNQPPGGSAPLAPSAAVSFCDNPTPGCSSANSFQLTSLRDLHVVIDWQNLPEGTHAQTVSFFLPDGNLYQAFEKSFAVPEGSSGALSTEQALPVAGTWITQRSLAGTWQVTLTLDGQAMNSQSVQLTR
jgi:hypothetical protein